MSEPLPRLYLLGPFKLNRIPGYPAERLSATDELGQQLRRKTRALLAYLAAAPQPVRREALAALFFPQSDDPLGALRWQLSEIRRQVGAAVLITQRHSVQFDHRLCWADVHEFDQILNRGVVPSVEQLIAALQLYRDEYLADTALPDAPEFDMWLLGQRAYYRRRYEQALSGLVEQLIGHKRYADALAWAQRLVRSDALAEPANRDLIRLYALNGQREVALAHYEQYRRLLHVELQAEPSPEAAALYEEIVAGRVTTLAQAPPAEPHFSLLRRHNLPASTTPFLGRQVELPQLRAMLSDPTCRLVTLVGPGGIGKTRLALQVATELAHHQNDTFVDGVYLVALAAISSGASLVPTIADAVGLSFAGVGDPRQLLLAYLEGHTLLLMLDNFEHLIDATDLLVEILRVAPGVTILVTSRVRLNLYEEWCFELQGLALPDPATLDSTETSSAVELFIQRARHIQHGFALERERPEVVRICQLLDGIPLAIELAAGRVRTHTCAEIADEIQRSLDFLATNLRNIPERHRSMRAAFEHSWRLMTEIERHAFVRLSVFRGGFDHRAAEDVAGVTRAILCELIDVSMLHADLADRYQLHELLRQFGAEKLTADLADDIRQRHSRFYAAYLQRREEHKLTAQEPAALQEIGIELENIRAGWQYLSSNLLEPRQAITAAETISQYAPMLAYFFDRRSRYREGLQLFRQTAANLATLAPEKPADEVGQSSSAIQRTALHVRLGEAIFCLRLGEFGEVEGLLKPSLALSLERSNARVAAEALSVLGVACMRMGRYDEAEQYLQESVALYTAIDDPIGRSAPLDGLGLLAFDQHQFSKAEAYWKECLAIFRTTGYQSGVAKALSGLASNMGRHGHIQEAKRLCEEALPIAEAAGSEQLVAILLSNLGSAARELCDHETSVQYYQKGLAISRKIGDRRWTAASLNGLGLTLVEMGHLATAKARVLESLELSKVTGNAPDVLDSLSVLGQMLASDAPINAVTLLSLVVNYGITRANARDRSQQALQQLKQAMSPIVWDAAYQRGKEQALGEIMQFVAKQLFAYSDPF